MRTVKERVEGEEKKKRESCELILRQNPMCDFKCRHHLNRNVNAMICIIKLC